MKNVIMSIVKMLILKISKEKKSSVIWYILLIVFILLYGWDLIEALIHNLILSC